MSPQELLSFWKKGKTLNVALYEFTAPEILDEYAGLTSELKNYGHNQDNLKISDLPTISAGLANLGKIISLQNQIKNVCDQLKRDLLNKIISEKLIGVGYEAPIKTSDKPQIIPLHIWPLNINEINWDDSLILKNGIEFLNIRIIKKQPIKKLAPDKINKSIEIKDKKTGRPSLKEKIIVAYEYLKTGNNIDYSKALKSHTELIQKTVQKLFPEIKNTTGMQHEAIRKVLSKRFKNDAASKSTSKL